MQSEYKTVIGENGRLFIPAKLRKELDIDIGEQVTLIIEDNKLQVCPIKQSLRKFQAIIKAHNKENISLVEALKESRREEVENE